jgi:aspartokinase
MQYMTAIRTLHISVIEQFELPTSVAEQMEALLDKCTDLLKGLHLIQELSPKSLDQLISYRERCSVRLMAERLCQLGVSAQALDAWNVGLRTDSDFDNAQLKVSDCTADICTAFAALEVAIVAVVTGFIAHDALMTLG